LKNIEESTLMTIKQKVDYKAVLQTLLYGSVNNIPDDEKNDVIAQEPPEE
jgi:hypothetical protein